MAYYLNDLNMVQAAKETTWGTPVATATAKIMGIRTCTLNPITNIDELNEARASLGGGYNLALTDIGVTGQMVMDANYEDLHYWLEGLLGIATPGGAGPYTRAYTAPLTAAVVSPRFNTLQFGQTGSVFQVAGMIPSGITLKGDDSRPVEATIPFFGKQMTAGTITALSDRTVTPMLAGHALLAIDAVGGTMGATAITATGWAWEMTINPKRAGRRFLGVLTPGDWNDQGWDATLKISMEVNATSAAYLTSILATTQNVAPLQLQVQVKYDNGLATTLQRLWCFQFAGYAAAFPSLFNDRGGVQAFDLVLRRSYNTAFAQWFKCNSITNTATIV
jgi:hypothetical protein